MPRDEPHQLLTDLVALCFIPLILATIHFLAPTARHTLALNHSNPTLLTLWSSAFVHVNLAHLLSNLIGYFLAIIPTYLLYLHWNRRTLFWHSLALSLLLVPPLVNLGSFVYFTSQGVAGETISRGFSGVVGAFAGMGLASVVAFVAEVYGLRRAYWLAQALVLAAGGVILVGLVGGLEPLHAGLVALGIVLSVTGLVRQEPEPLRNLREHATTLLVLGYATAMSLVVVYMLFPSEVVTDGGVTNVVAHAVGIVVGSVLPGMARMVTGAAVLLE
ncbi:hypothetical protein [Haloarchaeobius sp. DYHT-AS-18]|uniref:hypothetical protein n=1 Tax=Haloarchaeobius sp. DYHT-AS-18 TaxID=3446117 RepID=UPI003EC01209